MTWRGVDGGASSLVIKLDEIRCAGHVCFPSNSVRKADIPGWQKSAINDRFALRKNSDPFRRWTTRWAPIKDRHVNCCNLSLIERAIAFPINPRYLQQMSAFEKMSTALLFVTFGCVLGKFVVEPFWRCLKGIAGTAEGFIPYQPVPGAPLAPTLASLGVDENFVPRARALGLLSDDLYWLDHAVADLRSVKTECGEINHHGNKEDHRSVA